MTNEELAAKAGILDEGLVELHAPVTTNLESLAARYADRFRPIGDAVEVAHTHTPYPYGWHSADTPWVAGDLIRRKDGTVELVGTINEEGGGCGCCQPLEEDGGRNPPVAVCNLFDILGFDTTSNPVGSRPDRQQHINGIDRGYQPRRVSGENEPAPVECRPTTPLPPPLVWCRWW